LISQPDAGVISQHSPHAQRGENVKDRNKTKNF
jgi:hypothetical protein